MPPEAVWGVLGPLAACTLRTLNTHPGLMARSEFRLGPAILQTSDATAYVPDTWRAQLLRQLDSPSRASLAQTSPQALQWLLEEWPEPTLVLRVRGLTEDPAAFLKRMFAAKRHLAARGSKASCSSLRGNGAQQKTLGG